MPVVRVPGPAVALGWLLTRLLGLVVLLGGAAGWPTASWAQAPVQVALDAPTDGSQTGPELTVRGWAFGPDQPAPGVDTVAVYLDGDADSRGRFLGAATHGLPRPDVAAAVGDPRLDAVGYELRVTLPPGEHRLAVYAHASGAPDGDGWSAPAEAAVRVAAPTAATVPAQRAAPRPAANAPSTAPTGGSVCTNRSPSGSCLAYSAASGGIGMVCSEQSPDGDCLTYTQSYTVSSACAQYGPGGQCLAYATSPAVNPPPGGAGQTTALCMEYNAAGQCNRYSGAAVEGPTTLTLTAQVAGTGGTLTWSAFPAASTYEVLRCATPQIANCSPVSQAGGTSYPLPTRQNYWYAVRARGPDGQVLATSNFMGPL